MASDSLWKQIRGWFSNRHIEPVVHRAKPVDDAEWIQNANTSIEKLKSRFEGREAIYVEKGALRVRVRNIDGSAEERRIWADVEEIITPNLGVGSFSFKQQPGRRPVAWAIGASDLTGFSVQFWNTGYGGWSLYFDPRAIQGVLDLASQFPQELKNWERYSKVIDLLQHQQLHPDVTQRVFPDSTDKNA